MQSVRPLSVILALLFLVSMGSPVEAQTVTPSYYYSGATGGNYIPFGMHLSTSWQKYQGFYQANYFTGAFPGNITKVYFMRYYATTGTTYGNFQVSIGQSSATTFPTNAFYTPVTQGLSTASFTVPSGAAGTWFEIPLTTPVYYNPSQTLIIQVCASGITGGTGFPMYDGGSHSVPNVGRIYGGGSGCATTSPSGYTSSYHANFGFDIAPATPDNAGIAELISPDPSM
jgi:hypothetical protein